MKNVEELEETEGGKEGENPARFITPICIMGLIGPQCVFSGVSRNGRGEGVVAGGM